jgi:hypothetical protein
MPKENFKPMLSPKIETPHPDPLPRPNGKRIEVRGLEFLIATSILPP